MSSRIYSQEVFDNEIKELDKRMRCCPKCFGSNISFKDGYFILLHDYICLDCRFVTSKSAFPYKHKVISDIRNKKINEIIN